MNDLDKCIDNSQKAMFADDTANMNSKQNAHLLSNSDIRHMSKWCVDNKLTVNVEKCEAMSFGSKQPHIDFLMGQELTYQKLCKYLGIYLDSGLRLREHIEHVVKKVDWFC